MKNVLSLSSSKARAFFLAEENYISFDLPPYFEFSSIINDLSAILENKPMTKGDIGKAQKEEGLNYRLLNNKDGTFGWRPLQIIHPVMYVSLVHKITESDNWELIKKRFVEFKNIDQIECMSIPALPVGKRSGKENQVLNWWKQVEQKSMALALEYDYFFEADISDCYGSIYTHSIPWALHGKNVAKKDRRYSLLGNAIDKHIQAMSHGQTNGIPQGSVLMDFIAEMVLGYADTLLSEKLNGMKNDFRIIRYRDDYRIFVNDPKIGKIILKNLTEVYCDLSMKLNTLKTKQSDMIIKDSIKPDKYYYLINGLESEKVQQELLIIDSLAKKFPNSGIVNKKLLLIHKKILKQKRIRGNINVLISIVVNIALSCPNSYPIISAIISRFINSVSNKEKEELITKILNKFSQIPNTGHLQIWIQRISLTFKRNLNYTECLCKVAKDPSQGLHIWNSKWIPEGLKNILKYSFIDENAIKNLDLVINNEEVELFRDIYK